MPVIKKEYEEISLKDDQLEKPLLMALAWKKSHQYIRSTNWYADNFELDISALNLIEYCKVWTESLKGSIQFDKMELVPAPKASQWEFVEEKNTSGALEFSFEDDMFDPVWKPKHDIDKEEPTLNLRPLAHIPIREQSMMTLLMMGLANKVETMQGNPQVEFDEVHSKGVVSYGNRLYCQYSEDGIAKHSYGATTTYSKYFVDYRRFLERPYHFANKKLGEISPDERVYLVELDLSKFFDLIKRDVLIKKISSLAKPIDSNNEYKCLDNLLAAFEKWEWSDGAIESYEKLCSSDMVPKAPSGLPQGLVAAGFLSNVYMLEFDEILKSKIGESFSSDKLELVDYCRYVDDVRLVVASTDSQKSSLMEVKEFIENLLKGIECWDELNLNLNEEKTKVEIYRGRKVGVSKNLEEIQQRLSGPISLEEAENQLGQLENLLSIANSQPLKNVRDGYEVNLLAHIESTRFDVREDTLKRFAANKLTKVLNEIRHFTSQQPDENGKLQPGSWDYLQERVARRFIACWSHDPSLVLLLKKGLEIFPSTKILLPVLQQLDSVISRNSSSPKEVAVAEYCLSEIYRHSAIVIHKKEPLAIPAHANVYDFFELLQDSAAQRCESTKSGTFNLLSEQARFLLLVRKDTKLDKSFGDSRYELIDKLVRGFRNIKLSEDCKEQDIASAILMANQISGSSKECVRATSCFLEKKYSTAEVYKIFKFIVVQDKAFATILIRHARGVKQSWFDDCDVKKLVRLLHLDIKPLAAPLHEIVKEVSLLRLVMRDDNPFANEIMILKLMKSALNEENVRLLKESESSSIDLALTKVQFDHFSDIVKEDAFNSDINLTLGTNCDDSIIDGWDNFCSHVDNDIAILRTVGEFIRAVLVGSQDWTTFGHSLDSKAGYRGIRTTAYKRKIGLLTTPESISGVGAQVSGWLTGLITKLLKWPGIYVNDHGYEWPELWSIESVNKLIDERLKLLKEGYCSLSGMPSLLERQELDWEKNKKSLSVVMVQSKMPSKDDFNSFGLLLENVQYRSKHRKHIASVAELVLKHLEVQKTNKSDKKGRYDADLIVWPELAVHNDDLDVLVALSRKTNAIVFSGIGFIHQDGIDGPNNCAVWIVPTKNKTSQREIVRLQGKYNMMADEKGVIKPWRPYQLLLELVHPAFKEEKGFVLTGSICFDATDISLSADLRDKSNAYLVSALNQDVNTFDSMVEALHYHMYQHVVLVNSGEFGGSFAKAPYKDAHKRLIAHVHGNNQVSINTFEMNMFDFRRDGVGKSMQSDLKKKTAPAGVNNI